MRKILLGLAILSVAAAPAVAQQKSSSDARTMERASALEKGVVAAINKKDPAAIAAMYTGNGVVVGPDGKMITGRAAIQAYYTNNFKVWGDFKFEGEVTEAHAVGSGIWMVLATRIDGNGPAGPIKLRSHVVNVAVPAGKGWKVELTSVGANVAPPGAPTQ
jgi:uncharacterized protein (TIGR02246 family)